MDPRSKTDGFKSPAPNSKIYLEELEDFFGSVKNLLLAPGVLTLQNFEFALPWQSFFLTIMKLRINLSTQIDTLPFT
jgi:hypothetical protein